MRFDRESWRRLYRQEPLEQRAWPLVTRAIRDHLVRYPDELDGYLLSVSEPGRQAGDTRGDNAGDIQSLVVTALCRALGAHDDERPLVERALHTLLGDRYIVRDETGAVAIRNFGQAQQSKEARKKAIQRAKKKGDNPGTPGGQPGGQSVDRQGDTVGDKSGDIPRGRVRAEDEIRREEKEDPPTPLPDRSNGTALAKSGARPRTDPLENPPGMREDVIRLHENWKARFGFSGHKFRGVHDLDAVMLAEALDAHGEAECDLVLEHAPNDAMVNGKGDEKGLKHESIKYIFGNPQTFARLLREAKKAQPNEGGESVVERFARLKAREA